MVLRPESDNGIIFYTNRVVFNYVNTFIRYFKYCSKCSCLQNFDNLAFQGIVRIYIFVFGIQDLKKVVEMVIILKTFSQNTNTMPSITVEDNRNPEDQRISSYTSCILIQITHSQIFTRIHIQVNTTHGSDPILNSLNHFQIFLFWWTGVVITPVDLHCLSSPYFQHHFSVQFFQISLVSTEHSLQRNENNIHGSTNCAGNSIHSVCCRRADLSWISSILQCNFIHNYNTKLLT